MIGTLVRVALLRFVPRRLVPLLTAWQVIRMVRNRGKSSTDGSTVTSTRNRRSR